MALTQEQSDAIKQLFNIADADRDGFITRRELAKAIDTDSE